MRKISSIKLAEWLNIVRQTDHLTVQKLTFFLQSYHLAVFGERLVEDSFQAWRYGPASRKLYDYWKFNRDPEHNIESWNNITGEMPDIQVKAIDITIERFQDYRAWKLVGESHTPGAPWKITRGNLPDDAKSEKIIPESLMARYYRHQILSSDDPYLQKLAEIYKEVHSNRFHGRFGNAMTALAK